MARSGIMLARKYEERLLKDWPEYFYAQPKYNGNRCRSVLRVSGASLLSSECNPFLSVPHIEAALKDYYGTSCVLDGELYCHGMPIQEIRARVGRTASLHPDYRSIEYHVFDIVDPRLTQMERIKLLRQWFDARVFRPPIRMAPTTVITLETLQAELEDYLQQGFEGIILRNPFALYETKRSNNLLKLKPRLPGTYKITGAFEAVSIDGFPKDTLGGLYLTDGNVNFRCGCGRLSYLEREAYWDGYKQDEASLLDHSAEILYQELSTSQVPLQPILIRIL